MRISETTPEISTDSIELQTAPQTYEQALVALKHGSMPVTEEMIAELPQNHQLSPMSLIRSHILFITREPRQRIQYGAESIRSFVFGIQEREAILFQNSEEPPQQA